MVRGVGRVDHCGKIFPWSAEGLGSAQHTQIFVRDLEKGSKTLSLHRKTGRVGKPEL